MPADIDRLVKECARYFVKTENGRDWQSMTAADRVRAIRAMIQGLHDYEQTVREDAVKDAASAALALTELKEIE